MSAPEPLRQGEIGDPGRHKRNYIKQEEVQVPPMLCSECWCLIPDDLDVMRQHNNWHGQRAVGRRKTDG
jgi:hypothetical protein